MYFLIGIGMVIIIGYWWKDSIFYYIKKLMMRLIFQSIFGQNIHLPSLDNNQLIINNNQKSASIIYNYRGRRYILFFPFHPEEIMKSIGFQFFLIKKGKKIDITQQKGIPYLITANQLGGEKIELRKDNELIKEYLSDEIPRIP